MHNRIVRILHISDIHRGPNEPTSTKSLLGKLLTDIRMTYEETNKNLGADEPKLSAPDIIVISGDLTQRAAPEEYTEARKFIDGLLPLVDRDRGRVILVPGNHDLSWEIAAQSFSPSSDDAYKNQRVYHHPFRQDVKRAHDGTFWGKNESTYTERFRPFKAFFDSFYEGRFEYSLARDRMHTVYDLREHFGLVVAGFNSCDEIDAYQGADGNLHVLGNRATINTDAIYDAVKDPVFSDLNGVLLVAVFHHNIRSVDYGEDFLDPKYVQALRQQGFQLCLHGHVHDPSNENFYDSIQDRRLPVVGAGSLAAPYKDRPPAAPQGYNIIVFDRETGGIWVHTRRSDEKNQVWTPDFRWNGKPYFIVTPPQQEPPDQSPHPPNSGDDDPPTGGASAGKKRVSLLKRLGRKGRNVAELRGNHREMLLRVVGRVRLFGNDESRELREVFVNLSIIEEYGGLPGDTRLMGLMDAGLRRRLSILANGPLEPNDLSSPGGRDASTRKISPEELLRPGRRAIITGAPGCGKTTLLKYLALQTGLKEAGRWPIFLELKTVSAEDLKTAGGLAELLFAKAIAERLRLSDEERESLHDDFFDQLRAGNASIYLDGLDEVRHQAIFGDLCEMVSEFASDGDFNANTLVLSTRPFALHRASIEGLEQMEIQPLDQKQVEAFLRSYYPSDEAARRLAADLKKPGDLRELVRAPVMLAAIIELYRGGDAPSGITNRLEIYEKIARRLAVKLDQEKNTRRFSFRLEDPEGTLKLDFLQRLAFEKLLVDESDAGTEASRFIFGAEDLLLKAKAFVRDEGLRDVAPHTLADDVKATPLLREVSENKYAFAHTTLQEYLAAKTLARHGDRERIFCRAYFNPALAAQEILPMALGLSGSADELYEALEGLPESQTFVNLRLRARGVCYDANIGQARFETLLDRIAQILVNPHSEDEQPYRRVILRSLWFLTDMARGYLEEKIIPHLRNTSSFSKQDAAEALSILGTERSLEAVAEILTRRESGGYSLSGYSSISDSLVNYAGRALAKISPERAVPILASISTSYSYGPLDRLLKQIGTEEAFKAILARRKGLDWSSARASEDLVRRSETQNVTELLIAALQDPRDGVRGMAAETLGIIGAESAVMYVAACLCDTHFTVRWKAARALELIGSEEAVGPLLEALRDNDSTVRWCAASALGNIGSEKAVDGLIQALDDPSPDVKYHAASALGRIRSERAAEPLIRLLTGSGDARSRTAAAYAFYTIKSRKACGPLIQCLTDPNHEVRAGAAHALGNARSEDALGPLLERLSDESPDVREGVTYSLGQIGSREAIPHLLRTLRSDPNPRVRESALKALGVIGTPEVVEPILEYHTSAFAAYDAAEAMAQIEANILASTLPTTLRHENNKVRRKAAQIVGYYCSEPSLLNELARLAEGDPDARVRTAAGEAHAKYARKLELFESPASRIHNTT